MRRPLILSTAAAALLAGGAMAQQAAPQAAQPADAPAQAAPADNGSAAAAAPSSAAPAEAPSGAEAAPAASEGQTGAGADAAAAPAMAQPGADASGDAPAADNSAAPAADNSAAPAADGGGAPIAETPAGDAAPVDVDPGQDAGAEADAEHAAGTHDEPHVTDYAFSFEGPFGAYDQHQLQRGLQVYTQVCSACHGLRYVPIRTIGDESGPGIPEDQVRAYAAAMDVFDPSLNEGQGDLRTATPNDHFPHSGFPGAPDLSLMAKARSGFHGPYGLGVSQLFRGIGGPEYIATLLTSYTGETKEEAGKTFYENPAFPGGWIAMPPPLAGDDVDFEDGSPTEIHEEAQDIAAFLMWTAEPKLMQRKQAGFIGVLMLGILAVLLYITNKRIWAPVKSRSTHTPAE